LFLVPCSIFPRRFPSTFYIHLLICSSFPWLFPSKFPVPCSLFDIPPAVPFDVLHSSACPADMRGSSVLHSIKKGLIKDPCTLFPSLALPSSGSMGIFSVT
jgi:hypothetical protein